MRVELVEVESTLVAHSSLYLKVVRRSSMRHRRWLTPVDAVRCSSRVRVKVYGAMRGRKGWRLEFFCVTTSTVLSLVISISIFRNHHFLTNQKVGF